MPNHMLYFNFVIFLVKCSLFKELYSPLFHIYHREVFIKSGRKDRNQQVPIFGLLLASRCWKVWGLDAWFCCVIDKLERLKCQIIFERWPLLWVWFYPSYTNQGCLLPTTKLSSKWGDQFNRFLNT